MSLKSEYSENKELIISVGDCFRYKDHLTFFKIIKLISNDIRTVILDLKKTRYIDISAVGMILVLRDLTIEQEKKLKVVNLQPEVEVILKAVQLDKLLKF